MSIYEQIKETYPDIADKVFLDTIIIQDDSDGKGAYIAKWDYEKPIPAGFKLGKD